MPYNKSKRGFDQQTADADLMVLVKVGNEAALNELMQRYKARLYAFIANYVKDTDGAQDILQETFTRVYFKAESYNPSFKFSSWVYKIAINLCRDHFRKKKFKQLISLDALLTKDGSQSLHDTLSDPLSDVENLVDDRADLRLLEQEIEKLPHKLKTALILYAVEGHSQERCAELLGVTTKTIESRIYRARKSLRQKLDKNF